MQIWVQIKPKNADLVSIPIKKNENLGLIQPKFAFILFEFNQKNHIWIEIEQDM